MKKENIDNEKGAHKNGKASLKEETFNWLKKSEDDLVTSRINLKNRRYDAAAFFCQQSIEKALKALEIEKLGKFDKTHDLYFLGKKFNMPDDLLEICEELTEYYVQTRYPDTYADFDKNKVSASIAKAEKVMTWIKKNL